MNYRDYINILENALLPFIQENFSTNHYKFQDDNAPVHTAKNVIKYLSKKNCRGWVVATFAHSSREVKGRESFPISLVELVATRI